MTVCIDSFFNIFRWTLTCFWNASLFDWLWCHESVVATSTESICGINMIKIGFKREFSWKLLNIIHESGPPNEIQWKINKLPIPRQDWINLCGDVDTAKFQLSVVRLLLQFGPEDFFFEKSKSRRFCHKNSSFDHWYWNVYSVVNFQVENAI